MQIGMIGLGKMGSNMVRRLLADGHECVVYDQDPATANALAETGAKAAESLPELAAALSSPRKVWIMVPDTVVDAVVAELAEHLDESDIVIDGGNSYFPDDIRRAGELSERGIEYVDVGTSGGVWGRERGYCLMIGGETDAVNYLAPVFQTLAPGEESASPTPGRDNGRSSAHQGYLHCGGHGAGHFVKMVHNGIEYGVMAAYGEGFAMLHKAKVEGAGGARMDVDTGEVAELWRRGSVVS